MWNTGHSTQSLRVKSFRGKLLQNCFCILLVAPESVLRVFWRLWTSSQQELLEGFFGNLDIPRPSGPTS